MGNCFLYGNGGGTNLNFSVVGGTEQPENPKENTIWVNTDTEITGWAFMPVRVQPGNPEEGMVLIHTGAFGNVAFNALKKNDIHVYPLYANQYVNGLWEGKTALVYIGGEWNEFATFLYNLGDECTDLTGGWYSAAKKSTSSSNGTATAPTITRDETSIKAALTSTTKAGIFLIHNSVDLTGYSKLIVEGEFINRGYNGNTKLAIWSSIGTYANSNIVAEQGLSQSAKYSTLEIDVEELTGGYLIGFVINTVGGSPSEITIRRAMLVM